MNFISWCISKADAHFIDLTDQDKIMFLLKLDNDITSQIIACVFLWYSIFAVKDHDKFGRVLRTL